MLWTEKHGKHAATIEEQCRKMRTPLPEFLANKPEIGMGLHFVYSAFWELNTCRDVGYGEGPIPWVAIDRYCIRHNMYGHEFDRFSRIIRMVDNAYLKSRQKKEGKGPINPDQDQPKTKEKPTMRTR